MENWALGAWLRHHVYATPGGGVWVSPPAGGPPAKIFSMLDALWCNLVYFFFLFLVL